MKHFRHIVVTSLAAAALASCGGNEPDQKGEPKFGDTHVKETDAGSPSPDRKTHHAFSALDKDESGTLTENEVGERIWVLLSGADTDGDGEITKEQLRDIPRPKARGSRLSPKKIIGIFDADGNGRLGFDEMPEWLAQDLAEVDADEDGEVSASELNAEREVNSTLGEGGAPPPSQLVSRYDGDGDGKLNRDELPNWIREDFADADTDNDGKVSVEEIEAIRKLDVSLGSGAPPEPAHLIQDHDQDGDGKLSLAELPANLRDQLARADSDGDGKISAEELDAQREIDLIRGDGSTTETDPDTKESPQSP